MRIPEGTFWIGSDHPFDLQECYLWFVADLDLAREPGRARFHLTADSRYRLWINGEFVGRGPERSWPAAMAVDVREVASCLRQGPNRISVQVYSPGYSHFAHVHRSACGMIGWLDAEGETLLTSGRDWRVRRDLSFRPDVPRISIYGAGAEDCDLARAIAPLADTGDWARARIVQPPQGPVWASLVPRTTPLLVEEVQPLLAPCETRYGPTPAPGSDAHDHLRRSFAHLPKAAIPDRLAAGHSAIWVFDLDESRICAAEADLSGGEGDLLTVSYAEKRKRGEIVLPDPATYCRMRPTDRFRLARGRNEAAGFALRGGRFLVYQLDVQADATPAPDFRARLSSYPLSLRDSPPDSDPVLAAVAAICRRTTLACLQDGFVDSVWRESSQWLGDVVAQSFALCALTDDPRPLRLAIEQAALGAAPDGLLPSILPGDVPAYVVTDYNFAWVELLEAWHRHPRGDGALITRLWPVLVRMLDRFDADRGDDGLIRSQAGRRLFLDWSAMDRAEPNLTYNLRYLHALQTATALAGATGNPAPAAWRARATSLAYAIRVTLCHAERWQESPGGAPACQLALAFLILTGLDPDPGALADQITARSLAPEPAPPGAPALASPFMHHYLFRALHSLNRQAEIRAIIAARWGGWATAGLPNTPENWSIDFPDGSACHGFSAHPLGWLGATSS